MEKRPVANVKLGLFVVAGLVFLVVLLYLIGKNENLFGPTYVLKAKFDNVQGLVAGNNVRFAGIQAGTVKRLDVINDTTIEVTMVIQKGMRSIIRTSAVASIGTEGLVGNEIVNITPAGDAAPIAHEGDLIATKKAVSMDDMLRTLYRTNNDVAVIASELKSTITRINSSSGLWSLLNDHSIPYNLRASIANIRTATGKAGTMVDNLNDVVLIVKSGNGSLGMILNDTTLAGRLNEAIAKINKVGVEADVLAGELNQLAAGIRGDVNSGKGPVHALLKDSLLVRKISESLDNIEKGTDGFNQNMDAIKHSFLFRGYFRKLEREKLNASKLSTAKKLP
jgi:phospholipid/cholesterol/gamma-HCH transport system substrate-binding protein